MKRIAVILAGGSGKRMRTKLPKQFAELSGKPVVQYSMETFADTGLIDEMLIVTHPDYKELIPVNQMSLSIPMHVIPGGSSRNLSSLQAIDFTKNRYPDDNTVLLFHDAARPNIQEKVIIDIIDNLHNYDVVSTVSNVNDTLYTLDHNNKFAGTLNRNKTLIAQTPQAFNLSVISKAYKLKQLDGNPEFTDDISIVNHYLPDKEISFVNSSALNIKISFPEDMELMEAILEADK